MVNLTAAASATGDVAGRATDAEEGHLADGLDLGTMGDQAGRAVLDYTGFGRLSYPRVGMGDSSCSCADDGILTARRGVLAIIGEMKPTRDRSGRDVLRCSR